MSRESEVDDMRLEARLRAEHGLIVGERTLEDVRIRLKTRRSSNLKVSGRSIQSGRRKTVLLKLGPRFSKA